MKIDWKFYLKQAYKKAEQSRNHSTQNGAVLADNKGNTLIEAANTLTPDGVLETRERSQKPLRYKFSVHAERNLVYKAAQEGIKTKRLTMICPWACCSECAQAIIQSGIKRLVVHKQALDKSGSWVEEVELGFTMLRESGVDLVIYDGKIGDVKILRSGNYWEP